VECGNDRKHQTLYNLVWGQCSKTMQQKLESLDDYIDIRNSSDGIGLLLAIKNTAYNYNDEKYIFELVIEAQYRVMVLRQNNMTPQQYYEKFSNLVSVYIHCGGSNDPDPGLYEHVATEHGWKTITEKRKAEVKEMYWATLFILHADPIRYGGLITDLQNDYLTEIDKYPKTMTAALSRLTNWKSQFANIRPNNSTSNGVSFTNVGDTTTGEEATKVATTRAPRAPRSKAHITCFTCQEKGHYSTECPKTKTTMAATGTAGTATANTQSGVELVTTAISSGEFDDLEMHSSFQFICAGTTLTTASTHIQIPPTWILLDNQSTIDVFCNKQLLVNIHKTNSTMSIHCNAGVKTTSEIGDLPGYGEVWYHPTGIANILSLSRVRAKGFQVTYENEKNCFILTSPTGRRNGFEQSPKGLYFIDTAATQKLGSVFVTTVESNKAKFSQRDYLRAIEARKLLCKIGRPSQKTFLHILDKNLLPNCPVTHRDAMNAQIIFGPDIGSLKGKTVRQSTIPIQPVLNDLPLEIMSQYRDVTLTGDIFFVNKIMFLVTRSRHIQFSTVETIPNRKPETVLKALINVRNIYRGRGFNITHLLFDGEYECLRGDMASLQIQLNTASNDEHVPDIERFIRTLKERTRAIYNTVPFQKMPDRLIIEMICACNFWLNSFPPVSGISSVLSPRAIVTGSSIDYNRHCQLEFGAYVQTHEDHDNTMSTRTVGGIALRPTGNDQGGYYFFSLASGRVLNRNHWTELPMPSDVIDRIHIMARRNPRGVKFSDRHLMPYVLDPNFPDDDNDSTFAPDDESDDDDNDDDDENMRDVNANIADDNDNEPNDEENGIDEEDEEVMEAAEVVTPNEEDDEVDSITPDDEEELEDNFDDKYGARMSTHGLRPRKPRDYGHLHTTLEHIVMTQYSVKKGLKVFGEAGVEAVLQELQQLHDRKVI
jgi:hypothetical protein